MNKEGFIQLKKIKFIRNSINTIFHNNVFLRFRQTNCDCMHSLCIINNFCFFKIQRASINYTFDPRLIDISFWCCLFFLENMYSKALWLEKIIWVWMINHNTQMNTGNSVFTLNHMRRFLKKRYTKCKQHCRTVNVFFFCWLISNKKYTSLWYQVGK